MKKFAWLAVVALAAPAMAAVPRGGLKADSMVMDASARQVHLGRGVFAENFEAESVQSPFTPSVSGWSSAWDGNTAIVSPGLGGSSLAAQHAADGSDYPGMEFNSPVFAETFGILSARVQIDTTDSLYQFVSGGVEYYNTRVNFELDGSITVAQVNAAQDAFEFLPSTGSWTPGVEFEFAIQVDPNGALTVYQDGAPIFVGEDTSFALGLGVEGITQYLTFAGNTDGGSGTYTFDDVAMTPEPATLALLAFGGAVLLRRRR